jgi:hypothetical protein
MVVDALLLFLSVGERASVTALLIHTYSAYMKAGGHADRN